MSGVSGRAGSCPSAREGHGKAGAFPRGSFKLLLRLRGLRGGGRLAESYTSPQPLWRAFEFQPSCPNPLCPEGTPPRVQHPWEEVSCHRVKGKEQGGVRRTPSLALCSTKSLSLTTRLLFVTEVPGTDVSRWHMRPSDVASVHLTVTA